jgi:hypothetical protein
MTNKNKTQQPVVVFETIMQSAFRKFLGVPVVKPSTKVKPMWNASVSYGTYQKLKRQGILA